jgi:hypothetical protein
LPRLRRHTNSLGFLIRCIRQNGRQCPEVVRKSFCIRGRAVLYYHYGAWHSRRVIYFPHYSRIVSISFGVANSLPSVVYVSHEVWGGVVDARLRLSDLLICFAGSNISFRDYQFKILEVGDSGVGKSNLMLRYTVGKFEENYSPAIGP